MKKVLLLLLTVNCQLSIVNSFAQTNVSGGIYANTTWTLANSPYIVVDTVVVFPGVTLTIEPGVVVKFDSTKFLWIRQATLVAQGTITDSITFTSSSPTPTPGSNLGVWLDYVNTPIFNYCNFLYARYGLSGSYNDTDTMLVKNSTFSYNLTGYYISNGSSSAPTYVDSCIFINNTYYGYTTGSCQTTLSNSYFANNGTGLALNGTINSCTIRNNQTGITGLGSANNCIINSNHQGVVCGNSSYYSLYNCTIDSNSVDGVYYASGDIINCEIKYNGIGLDQVFAIGGTIKQNIIEDNNIGLKGVYASNGIYCNRICNNTSSGLQILNSSNYSIPNNYWCTTDSTSTEVVIWDGYDDISLGIVSFMPLDTLNCYLTGCNLHITANVTNATCDTCHNGSATAHVSNGFAPYSYTWYTTPIQITQTATNLASGTYTVCVTDGHGCSTCNYNVYVDSTNCTGFAVHATATNESCTLCNDGTATATITAGTPPYYYTWYTVPIQSTPTATGLAAGSYAVCVNDVYGCAACDTVTVGIGSCSAYYTMYADTAPHTYDLVNMASGTPPLTYDWNWGDGSPHDTASYPSHTYAGAGNYTICLSITDSAGCTNSYCHSFYLLMMMGNAVYVNVISPLTGIHENISDKLFSISPNPASNYLTLHFAGNAGLSQIRIINLLGEMKYYSSVTGAETNLNISTFARGIYFVEVTSENKVSRERFVKQ